MDPAMADVPDAGYANEFKILKVYEIQYQHYLEMIF